MATPVKHFVPDLATLEIRLNEVLASNFPDFLAATHTHREGAIANVKLAVTASVFAIAVFFALFFITDNYGDSWVSRILVGCFMLWLTVVLLSGKRWLSNSRLLAKEMNMALVPIFSTVINRALIYTHDDQHRAETRRQLNESSLMTVGGELVVEADDIYTIYDGHDITVRELMVTAEEKGRDGRLDTTVKLFKGVLVVTSLDKKHEAETYISTEGDKMGFAHQSFWSNVLGTATVKETILEWGEFEESLHVATSDPTAARELLTPQFMQDLYDWWKENKLNFRIAFKGNKMYMLLPEESILIATSTMSDNPKAIKRYAWTLLRPIWRSLILVEGVSS